MTAFLASDKAGLSFLSLIKVNDSSRQGFGVVSSPCYKNPLYHNRK